MITDALFELKSFQRQYEAVLQLSVSDTIPSLIWSVQRNDLIAQIDWNNLLGISSILCNSEKSEHLDAALRIAQTCLSTSEDDSQKYASAIILENLTNHPAIQLAIRRELIRPNYKDFLPLPFQLQTTKVTYENTTFVAGKLKRLNRFQKSVYEAYSQNDAVSISAPTSAGKSYILYNVVLDSISERSSNIVYLVPTRALISQVEEDLRDLIKQHELININISTVPQVSESAGSNIFVFTQERLHWFLIENESFPLDLIIVDEAQKIEDGNRGILLQQKIEEVLNLNPNIKIFFSSPFTSNPEILIENISSDERKRIVDTQFVAVNQNLLYISQIPRKAEEYNVRLILVDKYFDLGILRLRDRPGAGDFKKFSFIADAFSAGNSGNLVYTNGAAEAEKVAAIFHSLMIDITDSEPLNDLIKLVGSTIHRRYSLVTTLRRGVAFHYGNMPLLIRQEIERLFKEGIIKVLICTSTLLEGVNLPSKTIFIRKPTRGKNKPLSMNDFWNLAGRAGRWGKEFSGNIVCVDPTQWVVPPNPNKTKQIIRRATDIIKSNPNELIEYVQSRSPRKIAETRQDLEFAFGYFYNKFLLNELPIEGAFYQELNDSFSRIRTTISLPDFLIRRNPGISPIAQQELFDYFKTKMDEIDELIPVYPEDVNAYEEYIKLVARIGKTLSYYPPALTASRAVLLINWMSGKPLSYIISTSYAYYQRSDKYRSKKTLPIVIRECMDNVENFARFRFAKDSSCYIDVLRYFLRENERSDLLSRIPELNLWLEFGVSQKTHLSLLSLGLTRSTVTEISQYIPASQMNKEEAINWLRAFDYNAIELSPIMIEDIKKALE
jgi:hypothetical protein